MTFRMHIIHIVTALSKTVKVLAIEVQVYFMERKINSSTNGSLIKSSHTATRLVFFGFYMLKARECTAFSAPSTKQEINKTSRIKVDMLNTLMLISINGPDLYSPECNEYY